MVSSALKSQIAKFSENFAHVLFARMFNVLFHMSTPDIHTMRDAVPSYVALFKYRFT